MTIMMIMAHAGVMIVIIRVMTSIIATSSASLLVPSKLSSSHPLHCQGCLTLDDQMMRKTRIRRITIIVASLAPLTAVMMIRMTKMVMIRIIVASSAPPMLPNKS